jgi:hypothetical protein
VGVGGHEVTVQARQLQSVWNETADLAQTATEEWIDVHDPLYRYIRLSCSPFSLAILHCSLILYIPGNTDRSAAIMVSLLGKHGHQQAVPLLELLRLPLECCHGIC